MARLITPSEYVTGYKVQIGPYTVTKPYELIATYPDGTRLVRDPESPQPHSPRVLKRRPALGRARRSGSRGQPQPSH